MIRKLTCFFVCLVLMFAFNQISYAQCNPKCYSKKKFIIDTISIKLEKLLQSTVDVSLFQTPLVCDVDNDGKTEIITSSIITQTNSTLAASNILILDAKTGKEKKTISTPYYCAAATLSILLNDINNDCIPEIIIATLDDNINELKFRGKLICYDINGNIAWVSNKDYGSAFTTFRFGGALGSADFNHDGLPEVYIYNEIFNAQTGIKLCAGGNFGVGQGNSFSGRIANSLAINVDDDPNDLELVCGYTVYKIEIKNLSGESGNLMIPNNIQINNTSIDGLTSFADLNSDSVPEIIISSNASSSISGLYIYSFINGAYSLVSGPNKFFPNEVWNTGIPLITKFTNNTKIKFILSKDDKIIIIDLDNNGNLNLENIKPVNDGSGILGLTSFDLNGDGKNEIIYRDEKELKIFNQIGNSFQEITSYPCLSPTVAEMPIVAALEKNGDARICVTCMDSNNQGHLTVFGPPPGQRWAPARNIWHQYAYNPLFINDDGSIPQYMHNPATYKNGKYNNFMVQESLIDEDGNYPVAAASLTGTAACIDYDVTTQQYTVDFSVHNRVDASASALSGLAVAFYNGNPEAGGTLIGVYRTTADIAAGNTLSGLTYTFAASNLTSLYMIVNTDQYPIMVSDTASYGIDECDYTDNVFILPAPKFTQTKQEICQGDSYNFFGQVLTASGTYYHEIAAMNACDSVIVALELVVKVCQVECDPKCHSHKKYIPTPIPAPFGATKLWELDNIGMFSTPKIMDVMGNDNIPELFLAKPVELNLTQQHLINSNGIIIYNTISKDIIKSLSTAFYKYGGTGTFLVADVNNDCEKEIIVAASESTLNPDHLRSRLICYDLDGNMIWISDIKYGQTLPALEQSIGFGGGIGVADFNQDDIAEVYIYNEIFNATTGVKLCDGGLNGTGRSITAGAGGMQSTSIAANFDGDSQLELAAAYSIYKVNITNRNGTLGNTMTPYNINIGRLADGFTSVADLNDDGTLDVVVSGGGFSQLFPRIRIDAYGYTLANNQTKLLFTTDDNGAYKGLAMIDKKSKTSLQELYYMRSGNINDTLKNYVYKESLAIDTNWNLPLFDNSNGTVPTLFDLDGDGIKELIHRDEVSLKIFNLKGNYPALLYSYPCVSGTSAEMAIVADIDGSGEAKICVTCAEKRSDYNGKLVVFGPPPGQRWAPARKIWHQYAYNPLFINDDGTVPQYMHNPATYKNGKYNNFMVQESLIDEDGNYPVVAASLTGTAECIDYDVTTQQYTVDFSVHNRVDASASALSGLAVAFYNGNPEAGGTLIGVYRTTADISAGNTLSGLTYTFTANNLTSLYMIVNTDQYPIMVSDTASYGIDECDYTDNVFILPAPKFSQTKQEICQGDSYDFFGQALTASGTYIHEIADINVCDSVIVALELLVSTTKSVSLTATACDTYTWNGQTYTTDGSYIHDTQSVNGCDSITTLNLSVFRSDQLNFTQQSCEYYTWNGQTYNQSGIYTYRTQNIHGCDSIVTLDLTVFPSIDVSMTHAACDTFVWNGQSYTESGIYTFQAQTQHGCDSTVTLDLTISDVLYTEFPVTACDSYTWNGQTYDTAGDYTFTGISMNGCDSIATLRLSILSSSFSTESQTACTSFTWNNQTYDQSGTYLFQTKNAQGCDSTATLYLTIHQPTTSEQWVTACDSYYWDHNPFAYFTSGTYTQTIRNKNGCDSLMTLHLFISKSTSDTFDVSACEVYYVNGNIPITYNTKFNIIAYNIYGCDSNTVYNITIHQPQASTTITENVCDSLTFFGNTLDSTGIYTHTLSDQFGCDSTITLQLNVLSSTFTDRIATCDSYTWPQTGLTYDTSGIFSQRFTNAVGCDSTYTLDLRILPSYQIEDTVAECGAYLWPIDGSNYDHSGRYSKRFITRDGCDSTYTLVLDIRPQHLFVDTVITDQDYLWDVNNTTYTQSGIYTQKFLTSFDCDSVHILDLRINKSTDIFFPNIISPDGINGFFTGYSQNTAMTFASLSVYDRWGNLLFHKENFPTNDPLLGWNGKFQGRDVVPGVFTWLAVIRLPDGNTSTLSGDVTVVR